MSTISEFDFEIMYIKGKDNIAEDALSRRIQVNHLESMSSYGKDLQDRILQAGQQDVKYIDIMHRLQQSTGTNIGDSTCIGTCDGTGIGTCTCTCNGTGIGTCTGNGTCTVTGSGTGTGVGAQVVDYCLT